MNHWTTEQAEMFSLVFWAVVIGVALLYALIQHYRKPKVHAVDLEFSVDELAQIPHTVVARPDKVRKPKTKGGHRILAKPPAPVPFDAKNRDHLVALAMLMRPNSKLHPTVRFDYDSSRYDNAYSAALCALAEHTIPYTLQAEAEALATKPRRTRKKTAQSRPSPVGSKTLPVKTTVR